MAPRIQAWLANLIGFEIPLPGSLTLLVVAFLASIWVAVRRSERCGVLPDLTLSNLSWMIVFALVGSRIAYWVEHTRGFSIQELLVVWQGGLSLYGGVLGAVVGALVAPGLHRRQWLRMADASSPAFGLGLFIGRLGCFLNGDDFGVPAAVPWAVRFPVGTMPYEVHLERSFIPDGAVLSLPVHPTQLYEAAFGLMLLAVLWRRLSGPHQGVQVITTITAYASFRFALEFIREPSAELILGTLTVGQALSLVFIVLAVPGFVWVRLRQQKSQSFDSNLGYKT